MNVLNTLFVLSPGACISKDHKNLLVKVDGDVRIRIPIHGLASIVCFGHVMMSPDAMGSSAAAGIHVAFFSQTGRFIARVEGVGRGSLRLRRSQLKASEDSSQSTRISRSIVLGKIANSRQLLLRRAREGRDPHQVERLSRAADHLGRLLPSVHRAETID